MKRPSRPAPLGLAIVAAVTAWVSLGAWHGFAVSPSEYLMPAGGGIAVVTAIGMVARRLRMPALFVLSCQALGILLLLNLVWGTSLLPGAESIRATTQAFADSVKILNQYEAPIPANLPHSMPVLILGGLLCHLLVDFLALTLSRVPLSGLPLLVIHTLPVSILDRPVNWAVFALTVFGYLVLLALDEGNRINLWGRDFGSDPNGRERGPFGPHDPRRHPIALGTAATALALVVPLALPSLGINLFGAGRGPGSSDGTVRITNPMTDLRRDLVRNRDIPLITVVADDAEVEYLRTSVLTTYNGETWTPGDRNLPSENSAQGSMPLPIGLDPSVPTESAAWSLEVLDSLESMWLPTPANLHSIEAGPDWRYDSTVLDFHSASNEVTTAGVSYSLSELVPVFSSDDLAEAGTSVQPTRYTEVPGLPDSVSRTAAALTEGLDNDFERAMALQDWFRSDEFTYSLETRAGNGNDALEQFLEEKVGYCEQFASAMAVMAREVGIPARVAVGFYQGRLVDNDTYEFSSHDLHAWPELYFEGYGWVRFEPTPAAHIPDVPDYTEQGSAAPDETSEPTAQPTTQAPSRAPTAAPPTATPAEEDSSGGSKDSGFPWGWLLPVAGVVLLVVALLLAPRLLRRRRAAQRWQGPLDPAEAAWAELRDVCLDLRRPWPTGRSPRATAAAVSQWFAAPDDDLRLPKTGPATNPAAVEALELILAALEEHRYAPWANQTHPEELRAALDTCVIALERGVPKDVRVRAGWAPASLLPRSRAAGVEEDVASDEVGDHVH